MLGKRIVIIALLSVVITLAACSGQAAAAAGDRSTPLATSAQPGFRVCRANIIAEPDCGHGSAGIKSCS